MLREQRFQGSLARRFEGTPIRRKGGGLGGGNNRSLCSDRGLGRDWSGRESIRGRRRSGCEHGRRAMPDPRCMLTERGGPESMTAARLPALALLLTCHCGSSTCRERFGQDCGPEVAVTLRYYPVRSLDAGVAFGGSDGGLCPPPDGGAPTCACSLCEISHTMPLAQFEFAVRPRTSCAESWTSASAVTLVCGACGNGFGTPIGAEATACVWAPPLLSP